MKLAKKAILVLALALAVGQVPMTAMAHGRGHHRAKAVTYSQCTVDGCEVAGVHCHNGVYCYGQSHHQSAHSRGHHSCR